VLDARHNLSRTPRKSRIRPVQRQAVVTGDGLAIGIRQVNRPDVSSANGCHRYQQSFGSNVGGALPHE
jgi:hypothetical protein